MPSWLQILCAGVGLPGNLVTLTSYHGRDVVNLTVYGAGENIAAFLTFLESWPYYQKS